MKQVGTICFILLYCVALEAQEPFVCRGDYYLTLRPNSLDYNVLYTVRIDPQTNRVTFRELPNFSTGFDLNAMGYRSTDNYIYIINQKNKALMKIGSDGSLTQLRELTEIEDLRYFAGACTPDGRYLVISGTPRDFILGSSNRNLVFIDLTDPTFPTRTVLLQNNPYLFFDMDFDPFSGICYAYDSNNRTLITINTETGQVSPAGRLGQPCTSMGTLFFDAFGQLYGYGRPSEGNDQNTLFNIDKRSGVISVLTSGEPADRSDGCSCPYTIELEKSAFPRVTSPCSEVLFTFTVANASATERFGIDFYDLMPEGFELEEIIRNPYGGDVIDTGNPSEILIRNMSVPLGIDSIVVKVRLGEDLAGTYLNQARLNGLPESMGGFTLSDDPTTLAIDDPTAVEVLSLNVDLQSQNRLLCSGDTLLLNGTQPFASYRWHDGSTSPSFAVTEAGTYWVEASTLCERVSDTIIVELSPPLFVNAGEDREIILGDSVLIQPMVTGVGPFSYSYSESDEVSTLSCSTCEMASARPFFDTRYKLTVTDGAGCAEDDYLDINVDRNVYIWIPNAFSPNQDGINDFFYIVGRFPYLIESFEIFSRWGQRLFHKRDIRVNSERDGWDGRAAGSALGPGVYVYKVTLGFPDGSRESFAGDVTLIR